MRTDDLDTAPNEERDEEKIKEVSQSHPQWESELERVVHNANRRRVILYLSHMLAMADGLPDAQWNAMVQIDRKTKCRMSIL